MDTENCTQGVGDGGLRDRRKVKEGESDILLLSAADSRRSACKWLGETELQGGGLHPHLRGMCADAASPSLLLRHLDCGFLSVTNYLR